MSLLRLGVALCLCVAMLFGGPGATSAQSARGGGEQADLFRSLSLSSRKEPIQINADSLELDYKGSTITYLGNVQVTQGDVTLTSDRLAIAYDTAAVRRAGATNANATGPPPGKTPPGTPGSDRIKQVVADGNVRIKQGQRLAEGKHAIFDQAAQTIVLSDGAVLHDGPNQVAGERVIVYLQEERSVVESGSNSRVKAVLYPGQNADGDARGGERATPQTSSRAAAAAAAPGTETP